jgi:hypothetical protein
MDSNTDYGSESVGEKYFRCRAISKDASRHIEEEQATFRDYGLRSWRLVRLGITMTLLGKIVLGRA